MRKPDDKKIRRIGVAVIVLAALGLMAPIGQARADDDAQDQTVTFYRDVMPIVQDKCQDCHRPGGRNSSGMIAPMSFMSYAEVRPWAKSIKKAVVSEIMPPWGASRETSAAFGNYRGLSLADIATIARWVDQGAKAGDVADAPYPREFLDESGWIIGEPDLILQNPEPYFVTDEVVDDQPYISFRLTEDMLPEARWIKAIEYKPNCDIVHHLTGYVIEPEAEDEARDYFSIGGIASGSDPTNYPDGFGRLLQPGSEIILSIHYHKEAGPGTSIWNQVSVGFKFYPEGAEPKRTLQSTRIANMYFEIPPGHSAWKVGSSMDFDEHTLITSLNPHMHFRGKSAKYTAYYPDGTEEVLLDVPRYDYGWQMKYNFRKPKLIAPGTRIEVVTYFDNSEAMGERFPELDTQRVVDWGPRSNDEMQHAFVRWTAITPEEADYYTANGRLP